MKYTFIILSFLFSVSTSAQKVQNIWTIGVGKTLDFNSLPPSVGSISNVTTIYYRLSDVCDENGDLLFYSDGNKVWNKNHVAMSNGTGVNNNVTMNRVQGNGLIIKQPKNETKYLVFSTDTVSVNYSIVDISLNNGLGNIISSGNILTNSYGSGIIAVRHGNCKDVWLILKEKDTKDYLSYLIDSNGINPVPVRSMSGSTTRPNYINYTEMAASRDGSRLARAYPGDYLSLGSIEIYNFDNNTGIVSSPVVVPNVYTPFVWLEFSPNGKVLYSSEGGVSTGNPRLVQYDVSLSSANAVLKSKYVLDSSEISISHSAHHDLKLGKDDKIYIKTSFFSVTDSLSVINNPDVPGAGCNFTKNSIYLGGAGHYMPDMLTYPYQHILFNDLCLIDSTEFSVSDTSAYSTFSWNFGDTISGPNNIGNKAELKHVFSNPGIYQITFIGLNKECNFNDTLYDSVMIEAIPQPLLGYDTVMCEGDLLQLNANVLGESYLWSDSSIGDSLIISGGGNYWVVSENKCGVGIDSIYVEDVTVSFDLGPNIELCDRDVVNVTLNAPTGYASYFWSTGGKADSIVVNDFGVYSVSIEDTNGCTGFDFMYIIALNCTGISENNDENSIQLFPNPTSGEYSISFGRFYKQLSVTVKDISGKRISSETYSNTNSIEAKISGNPGIYFIEVFSDQEFLGMEKVVKR